MSAKELQALIDIGTSLGYTSDELKQFITDERMRTDREKEKEEEKRRAEEDRKRKKENLRELRKTDRKN